MLESVYIFATKHSKRESTWSRICYRMILLLTFRLLSLPKAQISYKTGRYWQQQPSSRNQNGWVLKTRLSALTSGLMNSESSIEKSTDYWQLLTLLSIDINAYYQCTCSIVNKIICQLTHTTIDYYQYSSGILNVNMNLNSVFLSPVLTITLGIINT